MREYVGTHATIFFPIPVLGCGAEGRSTQICMENRPTGWKVRGKVNIIGADCSQQHKDKLMLNCNACSVEEIYYFKGKCSFLNFSHKLAKDYIAVKEVIENVVKELLL